MCVCVCVCVCVCDRRLLIGFVFQVHNKKCQSIHNSLCLMHFSSCFSVNVC